MATRNLLPMGLNMTTTMTLKQLKEVMVDTGGWIFMDGYCVDICSKRLCPGVYKVWCERKK